MPVRAPRAVRAAENDASALERRDVLTQRAATCGSSRAVLCCYPKAFASASHAASTISELGFCETTGAAGLAGTRYGQPELEAAAAPARIEREMEAEVAAEVERDAALIRQTRSGTTGASGTRRHDFRSAGCCQD